MNYIYNAKTMAISLEIKPLADLYLPPIYIFEADTIERGTNAVG